ncbi:unnamed protein product [Absidia cylindrospora]
MRVTCTSTTTTATSTATTATISSTRDNENQEQERQQQPPSFISPPHDRPLSPIDNHKRCRRSQQATAHKKQR